MKFETLRLANTLRQEEWDNGNQITLSYRGNELGGECGEALNIIKKIERERLGIRGSRATVEQLAEELADVIICVDLVAQAEDIDLAKAVCNKFNKTSAANGLTVFLTDVGTVAPEPSIIPEEPPSPPLYMYDIREEGE